MNTFLESLSELFDLRFQYKISGASLFSRDYLYPAYALYDKTAECSTWHLASYHEIQDILANTGATWIRPPKHISDFADHDRVVNDLSLSYAVEASARTALTEARRAIDAQIRLHEARMEHLTPLMNAVNAFGEDDDTYAKHEKAVLSGE